MFCSGLQKWHFWNTDFKHIKPSKEERIQSVLPKPDGHLAHLKQSSAIEVANSVLCKIFTDGTIDEERSPSLW